MDSKRMTDIISVVLSLLMMMNDHVCSVPPGLDPVIPIAYLISRIPVSGDHRGNQSRSTSSTLPFRVSWQRRTMGPWLISDETCRRS